MATEAAMPPSRIKVRRVILGTRISYWLADVDSNWFLRPKGLFLFGVSARRLKGHIRTITHVFVGAFPRTCRSQLLPTRRTVATATKKAGEAEQVAEVVPSSIVVELVDVKVAFEK